MLSKILISLFAGFLLLGCASKPVIIEKPIYVGIVVPDNLYDCPNDPTVPDPNNLKVEQVIKYMKDFKKVTYRCRTSNGAIKEFIAEQNKLIEIKNKQK